VEGDNVLHDIDFSYCCTSGGRCESVRKIIERVFGMLKKRFRILRLSRLVKDMSEVEDMVKLCCDQHNMCLQVCMYIYNSYHTTFKIHTMVDMYICD
jgi:hypothetical protein